ncbi:MAG: phosphoglycerate mutase family protein [Treponema sp.]|nr:phosphoglycerate mutase family protein [Treponema sp.]
MDIYFIRHGDPDYSTDSLTDLGKIQAEKLSVAIKDWKIDELYQSPMGRAKETASYTAKKWNREPVTLDWMSEIKWGDASGNAYVSESPWSLNDKYIEETHSYPAGDSWKQLKELETDLLVPDVESRCKRFDEFLEEHGYVRKGQLYKAENPNEKSLMFFCHGGISAALIAHMTNVPFFQFNAHVGIRVTSISKLRLDGKPGEYKAAQLDYLNDIRHLDK